MSDLEEELKLELFLYKKTKKVCKLLKAEFPDRPIYYEPLLENLKELKKYIIELQEKIKEQKI